MAVKHQLDPILADEQEDIEHIFPVVNDRAIPMVFTTLQKSCTCTDATLEQYRLEPGERTNLRMRLHLRGRSGPQRLVCGLVEANGTVHNYEVLVTVSPRARYSDSVLHFGHVDAASVKRLSTEFRCYARTERELPAACEFTVISPHVRLVPAPGRLETTEDGFVARAYSLALELTTPEIPGVGFANLTARFKTKEETHTEELGVDWSVKPYFLVQPPQVFFGAGVRKAGVPVEKSVFIKRLAGGAVAIRSVTAPHEAITCRVESQTEEGARIAVTFDPSKGPFLVGDVVLRVDHPMQATLRIPVAIAPSATQTR